MITGRCACVRSGISGRRHLLADNATGVAAYRRDISFRYGNERQWVVASLQEPDRVAFKLTPTRLLTWDYALGDYGKLNQGGSMRTRL